MLAPRQTNKFENPDEAFHTLTELADCAPLNAVSVLAKGDVLQVGRFVESVFPEGGGCFVDWCEKE